MKKKTIRSEFFLVLAGYSLLVSVFFYKEIFTGHVLLSGESIYAFLPWQEHATGTERFQNFDLPLQYHPWKAYAAQSFKKGIIPLWNPYIFCGSPFIGNIQTQVFYPPEFIFLFLSVAQSFLFAAMLKILIAGVGTYYLARTFRIARWASFVSGVIYSYAGFIILWLGYPHATIAAWLPWILLFIEKLINQNRTTTFSHAVFPLCLVYGLQFLSGHPEMSFYLCLFSSVYFLARYIPACLQEYSLSFSMLIRFITAVIISFCLALMIYLPFIEYLSNSLVHSARGEKSLSHLSLKPYLYISFIMPKSFGTPQRTGFKLPAIEATLSKLTYGEINLGYCGTWTLFFAVLGIFTSRREKKLRIFTYSALCVLAILFGLPGISWILDHIPLLKLGFHFRTGFILNLALAILAGAGLSYFFENSIRKRSAFLLLCLFALIIISSVNLFHYLFSKQLTSLSLMQEWDHDYYVTLAQLAFGIGICYVGYLRRSMTIAYFIGVLVTLDLFLFGLHYNPSVPETRIAPSHPLIEKLTTDSELMRVLPLTSLLFPNMVMEYRLYDCRGYDAITPGAYFNLLKNADPSLTNLMSSKNPLYIVLSHFSTNLLKLLNIKYVIPPPDTEVTQFLYSTSGINKDTVGECFQKVAIVGSAISMYQYKDFVPRFNFVTEAYYLQNEEEILQHIMNPIFEPKTSVILQTKSSSPLLPESNKASYQITSVTTLENSYQLAIESDQPGYLVVSELDYPGWQAHIDGERTQIYRANYCFKALSIPQGKHQLQMRYLPFSFKLGFFFNLLGLLWFTLLGTNVINSRRRTRYRPQEF